MPKRNRTLQLVERPNRIPDNVNNYFNYCLLLIQIDTRLLLVILQKYLTKIRLFLFKCGITKLPIRKNYVPFMQFFLEGSLLSIGGPTISAELFSDIIKLVNPRKTNIGILKTVKFQRNPTIKHANRGTKIYQRLLGMLSRFPETNVTFQITKQTPDTMKKSDII